MIPPNIKYCRICGKPITEGYVIDGKEYVCSNDCLLKFFNGDRHLMEMSYAIDAPFENSSDARVVWKALVNNE